MQYARLPDLKRGPWLITMDIRHLQHLMGRTGQLGGFRQQQARRLGQVRIEQFLHERTDKGAFQEFDVAAEVEDFMRDVDDLPVQERGG